MCLNERKALEHHAAVCETTIDDSDLMVTTDKNSEDDSTVVTTASFAEDNAEIWRIVTTDVQGNRSEIAGRNVRKPSK